jgi:hypothetical protein
MYSFVLQDWITVSGPNGTQPLIQNESDWLDLSAFQDVVAWIDVQETKPPTPPTLFIETAPAKDDTLFLPMGPSAGYTMTAGPAPVIVQLLAGSCPIPLATFLRWRIIGVAGGWDACFRIIIAANAPGMAAASQDAVGAVAIAAGPMASLSLGS